MDKERIIKAHIPDTAFVYGGIRGRTMSSRHQSYAWKALVEAGVKQVIDLRQDYKGDRYKDDSMSHGINYFHYPVHKGRDVIANMVKDYEVFCELIDRGEFFISCAMGLHRTDIALCTYWVFYGADRGKEPPILVGYLKEKGHDAGKIFHVLNTFYDLYIELEGVEPIPIEIFKERKEIIKRISRELRDIGVLPHLYVYKDKKAVMRKILFVLLSVLCTKSVAQEIERVDSIDLETGIIYRVNGEIELDSPQTDGHEDFTLPVAQIPLDECDSLTASSPIDRYGIVWKGGKCGIYDISKYVNVTRIEYKDLWFSFRKEIEGEYYSYFGWEEDDSKGVIGVAEINNQFVTIAMPKE